MSYIGVRKRGEEERFHPCPLRCIRRGIVSYETIPSILLHTSKRLKQNVELKHIIKFQNKMKFTFSYLGSRPPWFSFRE